MAEEATQFPQCPACRAEIPSIQWNVQGPIGVIDSEKGPPAVLVAFYCPQCYVVINCQFLPIPMPTNQRPVVIPGEKFRPGGRPI